MKQNLAAIAGSQISLQCGFTILELLVVGPKYFAQISKSKVKTALAQIHALEISLDQYRLDNRHYPTSEQGLAALNQRPDVFRSMTCIMR